MEGGVLKGPSTVVYLCYINIWGHVEKEHFAAGIFEPSTNQYLDPRNSLFQFLSTADSELG